MARKIATGIDIGTYHVKVMIIESLTENGRTIPKILGTGYAESKGLRHGYINNKDETAKCVDKALRIAEKAAGIKMKKALVSVGGIGLGSYSSIGTAVVSRADSEITELDVEKAIETSRLAIPPAHSQNRKIIHRIPIQYKIDGRPIIGLRPVGMKGGKLEVKTLFVTCLEQHMNDLVAIVEEAGVEVTDWIAAPIGASIVALTKAQKIAGVVLANIGAETASIVVYENNIPVSLEVFPLGSNDITNDIALGLKIPLEEAEEVKRGNANALYSRKKLEDIVVARLSDIFELVNAHLKKIGRGGLLPAGIVITGGGSRVSIVEDVAKSSLGLPSRVSILNFGGNIKDLHDSVWSVAYGLCLIGISDEETAIGVDLINKTKNRAIEWLKQFMP